MDLKFSFSSFFGKQCVKLNNVSLLAKDTMLVTVIILFGVLLPYDIIYDVIHNIRHHYFKPKYESTIFEIHFNKT